MHSQSEFGRFFLPGPTEVHPDVLDAMRLPMIGHRGRAMRELLERIDPTLRRMFGADRPVYISTSSATGFMETAVRNLGGKRVLCLVCGAFSERFYDIALACGLAADRLDVDWGLPNQPEQLRSALAENPGRYDLVTVVHSETSTGVLNPVADLAAVVGAFDEVLLAVDGVSSVGGIPIEFDGWGVDFLLTGAQKALALPPGLAFAVASDRALERARSVSARGFYFDLVEFDARARAFSTTNTPAVSLLYALERQLQRIGAEGVPERFERHRRMAERTWQWVDWLADVSGESYRVLAPAGYRSPTVTAVSLPDGTGGARVVGDLAERGITIATGYGKMKDAAIRIGHMGDHTQDELEVVLAAIAETLGVGGPQPAGAGYARSDASTTGGPSVG